MSRAPDILLITTDQQRGDCIGGAGRGVRTPNIQRLADRGARFDTCITPHPMCQAARASILTGKLPYSHGVRDNGRNLDPAIAAEGVAGLFTGAGYDTRIIGKAHLSTHETFEPTFQPECYISVADYPEDWAGPYMGFDTVDLMLRPHHHCGWKDRPYTLQYENFLDWDGQGGTRWARAKDPVPPLTHHKQVWRSALEDEWQSTSWIGDQTMEMLQENRDAPLMAWVSFPDPHPPSLPLIRGRGCMIRQMWTCRRTASWILISGRGGIARFWKARHGATRNATMRTISLSGVGKAHWRTAICAM